MLQTNSYQTENLRSLQFPLSDRGLISRNYSVLEVAPLNKPIGDDGYSPIELILLGVAEELSKLDGRNAYAKILCAKGSKVQNSIETVNAIGNWNGKNGRDKFNHLYENHFNTINNIPNIDIIHNHTYELTEYLSRHEINKPVVTTVHFSYETEDLKPFLKDNNYYVAISKSHKRELEKSGIPNARVVYNGIDINEIPFQNNKQDYIFSLGRITPDKGQDIAIQAALLANKKIVISGLVQGKSIDHKYFENKIKPYIELTVDFDNDPEKELSTILTTDKKVIYCPELKKSKFDLYKNASSFIFPIQWEEPFGLVMVESMAAGTPVIAYNRGSVPEIIEDKKNGYIVNDGDLGGLAKAILSADNINPYECRRRAMQFSRKRMAEGYANYFEDILYH